MEVRYSIVDSDVNLDNSVKDSACKDQETIDGLSIQAGRIYRMPTHFGPAPDLASA